MGPVVRRSRQLLTLECENDTQQVESHRSRCIAVESQLSLGIEPTLRLEWKVDQQIWNDGFKLLVFRNTSGFCAEEFPDDLNRHGALIVEKRHDAGADERLPEGTYFYTFVLLKTRWFGFLRSIDVLRFSTTVPSAQVALARIQDKTKLRELVQQEILAPMKFHAEIYDAKAKRLESRQKFKQLRYPKEQAHEKKGNPVVNKRLNVVEALIEAYLGKSMKLEELKRDPRFAQLSETDQKDLFERIERHMHPGDISAESDR
jgi:flagellar motility protein MotE (MotC chaperone)